MSDRPERPDRSDRPDRPDRPDPTDPADQVRRFFDDERGRTVEFPAGPERWARIMASAEATGRGGRGRGPLAALAAAAAVAVGVAGWALIARPGADRVAPPASEGLSRSLDSRTVATTPPTETHTGTTGATGATGPTTAGASPSVPPVPVPGGGVVPASFRVGSVTTADSHRLYTLGSTDCEGGTRCPALAASSDNGGSWRLVHVFTGATSPAGSGGGPHGATVLSDVRFANATVGWVFGGAALRTTDGGRTWAAYGHPGGDVIDLETDGKDVVLTTASGCADRTCDGDISVVRAPVSAASAFDVAGTINGGTGVVGAPIAWHGGHAYVSPRVVGGSGTNPRPVVLRVDGLHAVGASVCSGPAAGPMDLVAPASGGRLFGMCVTGAAAGTAGYAVSASDDGGVTWRTVSSDGLLLVNAGSSSATAADSNSLLAVSGGSSDVHGSMRVSQDGGVTWRQPSGEPPLPDRGWAWVGAAGGATYYAIPVDPSAGFWKSTDRGDTWRLVRPGGAG